MSSSTMSTLLKTTYKRLMKCEHCGRMGHAKAFCWDLSGKLGQHSPRSGYDFQNDKNSKQESFKLCLVLHLRKGWFQSL